MGILPGTCLFVYLGSLSKSVESLSTSPDHGALIALYVVSGVLLIAVVALVTVIARRAINRAMQRHEVVSSDASTSLDSAATTTAATAITSAQPEPVTQS